jgi:hypothetical protein
LLCLLAFVEGDIAENDDVAWRQPRSELGLSIQIFKYMAVRRCIDNAGGSETVAPQPGNEGLRVPFSEGSISGKSLALS